MLNHRICRVCWNCGSAEFRKLKPDRMIYFFRDRECSRCEVIYTLPMPTSVKMLLIVVGAVFTFAGGFTAIVLLAVCWTIIQREGFESPGTLGMSLLGALFNALIALLGIECLRQGIAGCNQQVTEPVDYSQAKSVVDGQD